MKMIISASRRTDIPHYFADWFSARRKAGHAEFRNAFGGKGSVSLRREDVAGYLFWTKYAKPFHGQLEALRNDGIPYAFQYTISGLGASAIEPHIPRTKAAILDFQQVRKSLPASTAIQWRYDPLVLSDELDEAFHIERFSRIAAGLEGATSVVNASFTEPYVKTLRRMRDQGRIVYRPIDPARHKRAGNNAPAQITPQRATALLAELSGIAARHGMELRMCSNPEFDLPASQCVSEEMFSGYGMAIERAKPGPSRPGCQCLKSIDIGMDNSCIGGCRYCYVVTSQQTALRNYQGHDPQAVMIR